MNKLNLTRRELLRLLSVGASGALLAACAPAPAAAPAKPAAPAAEVKPTEAPKAAEAPKATEAPKAEAAAGQTLIIGRGGDSVEARDRSSAQRCHFGHIARRRADKDGKPAARMGLARDVKGLLCDRPQHDNFHI